MSMVRGRPHVYGWSGQGLDAQIDLSDDCVGFQAQKGLTSPSGRFSIELRPRQSTGSPSVANIRKISNLYRAFRPNHMVSLGFDEPGGIMLGLVDRVTRKTTRAGPRPGQSVILQGRDFGKAFEADSIVRAASGMDGFAEYSAKVTAALGPDHPAVIDVSYPWGYTQVEGASGGERVKSLFFNATIAEVVQFILDKSALLRIKVLGMAAGRAGSPVDHIVPDFQAYIKVMSDERISKDSLHTMQATIWNYLYSLLDPDIYEIRIETIPNGTALSDIVLIIRAKPFDDSSLNFAPTTEDLRSDWRGLRTLIDNDNDHVIPEEEIISETLSRDDSQAFSHYNVTMTWELVGNEQMEAMGLGFPLVDTYNVQNFGLKTYAPRINLTKATPTEQRDAPDLYNPKVKFRVQEMRNRLFNWYRLNPFFENGVVVCRGKDKYRPGDPYKLDHLKPAFGTEQGMRFYGSQVSWSWRFGQHYTSQIQVTRGQNAGMLKAIADEIKLDGAVVGNPDHYAAV